MSRFYSCVAKLTYEQTYERSWPMYHFITEIISSIIGGIHLVMFGLYWYTIEKNYKYSKRVLFIQINLEAFSYILWPILLITNLSEDLKEATNVIYMILYFLTGSWLIFCLYG